MITFNIIYKRKKVLLALILTLIVVSGFFLTRKKLKKPQTKNLPVPIIQVSPTIYFIKTPFNVKETTPADKQNYVLDTTTIEITFDKELGEGEIVSIEVITEPKFEFEKIWQNNLTLKIKPINNLKPMTTYNITLTCNNSAFYLFSFTTNPYSTKELDEQSGQQLKDDLLFAKTELNYHKKYPWYSKLPIIREEYTIIYNFKKEAFRIRIKIENPSEDQKELIIQKALKDLENIGVDTKTITYYTL